MAQPPLLLSLYPNKDEVLNSILDKVFVEQQLSEEYISTITELFGKHENRECMLKLLENDYKDYQLNYKHPEEIMRRNV